MKVLTGLILAAAFSLAAFSCDDGEVEGGVASGGSGHGTATAASTSATTAVGLTSGAGGGGAGVMPTGVGVDLVQTGLISPLIAKNAPDGSGRLFIGEQTGTIRIRLPNGDMAPLPFLDLESSVTAHTA